MARISTIDCPKILLSPLDTSKLTLPSINAGTLVNSGICFFGGPSPGLAAVNIGPPIPIPPLMMPYSLEVYGISNFVGNTNQLGLYTCNGMSIFNGIHVVNGTDTTNALKTCNGGLIVNGTCMVNGFFFATFAAWAGSIVGTSKLFDIVHPVKGKGHRLAHASMEGPEFGVYHRGILKDDDTIELPDYWEGLVDYKTITVHLTPIGRYQYLSYDVAELGNRILVRHMTNIPNSSDYIHCSYVVYAERKDIDKLIVEYEGGDSIQDSMQQGGPRE